MTTTVEGSTQQRSSMPRYSKSQLAKLSCLVLGLFGSQVKIFQWVIQSETKTFNIFGSVVSISGLALLLGPNVCVAMFIIATIAL